MEWATKVKINNHSFRQSQVITRLTVDGFACSHENQRGWSMPELQRHPQCENSISREIDESANKVKTCCTTSINPSNFSRIQL